MAAKSEPHFFYRALFKPDSLDVFEGFDNGPGRFGRGLGYTQAWHRSSWSRSPYAVFNELICGEIGRFLRLPVPPFAITFAHGATNKEPLFSSLDFNFQRAKLPRVIPEKCVEKLPFLCAGVVVFDILIANPDRHDENLLVDRVLKPSRMHVFDHDQALLGGEEGSGIARLDKLRDRLGITGSSITGGTGHVLLPHIRESRHVYQWAKRVKCIPKWFIESVTSEAKSYGLEKSLADRVADFLEYRCSGISRIIDAHRSEFSVADWPQERWLL
jgi:hypothetical protein